MGTNVDADLSGTIGANVSGGLGIVGPIGPIGPVTVAGIPDTFNINVQKLPKIEIGVDPVHISVDALPKLNIGVDPLELRLEIASTRTHLPADFHVGLSMLGRELMCVRLCGEAQMINEPYRPNPCERCDDKPDDVIQAAPLAGRPEDT